MTEPPGLLMYSQMSAVRVLALEVEELGADLVGDVVVDGRAEEDHPVAKQPVEDVGAGIEARLEHLRRDRRRALGHEAQATGGRVLHLNCAPDAPS